MSPGQAITLTTVAVKGTNHWQGGTSMVLSQGEWLLLDSGLISGNVSISLLAQKTVTPCWTGSA